MLKNEEPRNKLKKKDKPSTAIDIEEIKIEEDSSEFFTPKTSIIEKAKISQKSPCLGE